MHLPESMRVRMAALHSFLSHSASPNFWIMALVKSPALNFFLPWYSLTISYIASATCSGATGISSLLMSELRGSLVSQTRVLEVVNMFLGEFDARQLEKSRPADPSDKFAHAFILASALGPNLHDVADRRNDLRPPGGIIGQVGDRELGEHRLCPGVGNLPPYPDGKPVVQWVGQRHRGTNGEAVPAKHAQVLLHLHGGLALYGCRSDRGGGAGGDDAGDLAQLVQVLVLHPRRPAMNPEERNVRPVHGTAHVQAAGQGNPQLAGQLPLGKVFVQIVHHRLDDAGGVRGRRVAAHPTLRVNDARDGVADAAHREAKSAELLDQGLDPRRVGEQELHVMAGRGGPGAPAV